MKLTLIVLCVLAIVLAAIWFLGPREPMDGPRAFNPDAIGDDVDAYLYRTERRVPNLRRGTQKHVLWADPVRKGRTSYALVYVHGFSASLEEVRPVPDRVAERLGANIFFTRLAGHGRDGAAMGEASVADWRDDLSEALEIGRRIGDKVILMGTSTGGTLISLALAEDSEGVAGVVFISPNFAMKGRGAGLLRLPFAHGIARALLGEERFFAPENEAHGKWWTVRYPSSAVVTVAAAVAAADRLDYGRLTVPALFIFSDEDEVVSARRTRAVAAEWGGPAAVWPVRTGPGDDRANHVVAGRILSPGLTPAVVERINEWLRERDI